MAKRREMPGLTLPAKEVEELIARLVREGHPPSEIGVILRDQHGIPSIKKATGKSVLEILEAQGLRPEIPEELMNMIRKAVALYRHVTEHKRDTGSRRSLEVLESRIHKLVRYYVREGKLPRGWRYDRERAALLVR